MIFKDCQDQHHHRDDPDQHQHVVDADEGCACIDRSEDIQPVTALQIGQQNDIMLIRVCVVQDAMFPITGIGLGLPKDGEGGYGIIAISAFVTEPI